MNQKKFNCQYRQQLISHLSGSEKKYDLLIVGGGITGAGLARDAALRGLKVLLVEARDFAFGTSSRSSKLVHGGLRYLENLEFKLVFEALTERQRLYRMAPHLVHPLRFVFPVYDFSRVGMLKLACGMWLYDALSLFKAKQHEQLGKKETLERAGLLSAKGLKGSFVYSDAYMDDDRLAIETLRSAFAAGADIINYVSAEGVSWKQNRVEKVKLKDELSGAEFSVQAHHLISTVGPWTDEFGHKVMDQWKNILKPSKGIHLTFSRARLAIEDAVVLSDDKNERIVFVIPRNDMVIVGTTDTSFQGPPEDVVALAEDVDYLLKVASEYFPNLALKREDILATYAGVRPLVKSEEASVGKTSREHTVIEDPRGVTFVAGGKYTTYRQMAESILDQILEDFSEERRTSLQRCATTQPLNPLCSEDEMRKAQALVSRWAQEAEMPEALIEELVDRHGMEASEILALDGGQGSADERYWRMEAKHALQQTMCLHLKDFFWRRSHLFLANRQHGIEWLPLLAEVFAEELGWSASKKENEIQRVKQEIQKESSWQ